MTVILRDNKENVLFNIEFTKGYFGGLEASTTKRDALWNVIGFIPFGMLVCLSAKRFNIVLALLTGLFLSETIECLQAIFRKGVFDVNDLKKVNDTAGHQAGDQYLRDACKVICDIFKHSPVFRVGGDEFAVIAQGNDYDHMEELLGLMTAHNEEARRDGGIVIACGMSKFENNECVATVFERADHKMYENKTRLKGGEVDRASENR